MALQAVMPAAAPSAAFWASVAALRRYRSARLAAVVAAAKSLNVTAWLASLAAAAACEDALATISTKDATPSV
jgi:hypothetical protein